MQPALAEHQLRQVNDGKLDEMLIGLEEMGAALTDPGAWRGPPSLSSAVVSCRGLKLDGEQETRWHWWWTCSCPKSRDSCKM